MVSKKTIIIEIEVEWATPFQRFLGMSALTNLINSWASWYSGRDKKTKVKIIQCKEQK